MLYIKTRILRYPCTNNVCPMDWVAIFIQTPLPLPLRFFSSNSPVLALLPIAASVFAPPSTSILHFRQHCSHSSTALPVVTSIRSFSSSNSRLASLLMPSSYVCRFNRESAFPPSYFLAKHAPCAMLEKNAILFLLVSFTFRFLWLTLGLVSGLFILSPCLTKSRFWFRFT